MKADVNARYDALEFKIRQRFDTANLGSRRKALRYLRHYQRAWEAYKRLRGPIYLFKRASE